MSMRASPGRTYKFYTGKPLFSFADGLSYTTFTYKWSRVSVVVGATVQTDDQEDGTVVVPRESLHGNVVNYEVEVTNTGAHDGAVSVLAFISSDVSLVRVLCCICPRFFLI